MKKITALLLSFLLLCTLSVSAFAAEPEEEITKVTISVTIPDSHKVTVVADGAQVFYEGVPGEEFVVGRLTEPRFLIRAESGKVIKTVTLNGEDVTDLLYGGYLVLAPVYEDKVLTVTTEEEPAASEEIYIVKGKVTLNGQPLADVDLELRSTLKTTRTDQNGQFAFHNVEVGKHSLTALKDGKVIGYLAFDLQTDSRFHMTMLSDGSYTLFLDENAAGVELHLVLNEETGTLVPSSALPVPKASSPQTGDNTHLQLWWILLFTSAACIVVLETYRRKNKQI